MYNMSPMLFKFLMGACGDSLASETNLCRWGYQKVARCPLCGWRNCPQSHVLSACPVSLEQGRYTFRHDLVLRVLFSAIRDAAKDISPENVKPRVPLHEQVRFVRSGEECQSPRKADPPLLQQATDWKVIADFNGKWVGDAEGIPTHVVAHTSERPDIILWSDTLRLVVMVELTIPAEVNVQAAHSRKRLRYRELSSEIQLTTNDEGVGWKVMVLPVEVTVRGFIASSVHMLLKILGLPYKNRLKNNLSKMAVRGSYAIWQNRDNLSWQGK